jgi:hypothetical protein
MPYTARPLWSAVVKTGRSYVLKKSPGVNLREPERKLSHWFDAFNKGAVMPFLQNWNIVTGKLNLLESAIHNVDQTDIYAARILGLGLEPEE